MPKEVQKAVRKEDISTGHARALLSVTDKEKVLLLFRDIINNKLSVRDVEMLVYGAPKTAEGKKKGGRKVKTDSELKPWVDKLTSCLATKVRMRGTASRGRIEIEYFSQDDLERILGIIMGQRIEEVSVNLNQNQEVMGNAQQGN